MNYGYNGSYSAPDFAYLSDNRPVIAYSDGGDLSVAAHDGLGWTHQVVENQYGALYGDRVSVAVDSQDNIGLAYYDGMIRYAMKTPLSGDWIDREVGDTMGSLTHMSTAFGPDDMPAIAALDNQGNLSVSTFDIITGDWNMDVIDFNVGSERINLAFDSEGNPAVAYVADHGFGLQVHYRIKQGLGWLDYTLPTGFDNASGLDVSPVWEGADVSLSFDADDIPVLSYFAYDGLMLAYDPILPEPASLTLLLAGLLAFSRRRR